MQALAFLLAASCWAAPKAVPRVQQLSFDFRPAPAFTMPGAPASVAAAVASGRPDDLYAAALETEYQAPPDDEIVAGMLQEAADRRAADEAYFRSKSQGKPRRRRIANYAAFMEAVNHNASLRDALKAAGYTQLKGENGVRIPLSAASEGRLLGAYQNTLRAARRALAQ